jgi:two-component system response regulator RegA
MFDHRAEARRILDAFDRPSGALVYHYVHAAVAACRGNISEASRRLGMHRRTVQRILASSVPSSWRDNDPHGGGLS